MHSFWERICLVWILCGKEMMADLWRAKVMCGEFVH